MTGDRQGQIIETMMGLEPQVKADLVSRMFFHMEGAELSETARANLLKLLSDPGVDMSISDLLATIFTMHEERE